MASKQEIDAFYSEVELRIGAKIRLALEIYASESKNVIVSETLAGRFVNGSGFRYRSKSYERKRSKRGNETGYVDFYFTGQTTRSITTTVDVEARTFTLRLAGRAAELTEWNRNRYDWFGFGKRERLIIQRSTAVIQRQLDSK